MHHIVKFMFLLLLCHNNGLGFDFNTQDTDFPVENNSETDHLTNKALNKNFDVLSTSDRKSLQNEKNGETKLSTTPLLPDDLSLEDDLQTSEQNSLWISKNAAEYENSESTVHNHLTSQEEGSETFELKHTESSDATSYDMEGSGDFLSTTFDATSSTKMKSDVMTSSTPIISSSTVDHDSISNILQSCLNSVCNSTEIKIHSAMTMFVPKSTDATVQCTSLSDNEYLNKLHWYFVNETTSILKHTSTNQSVSLELSNAETKDSGLYKCLKFKQDFCCHAKLSIIVYEPPNYKLHILIAASIAIIGLVLCVILTIIRTNQNKKYFDTDKAKRKQSASLLLL